MKYRMKQNVGAQIYPLRHILDALFLESMLGTWGKGSVV